MENIKELFVIRVSLKIPLLTTKIETKYSVL